MKHAIGKKIFTAILAPFLIIFAALTMYIAYMVFQYVNNWTELEIKGISEINAAELEGKIYSVQVSVQSAADTLAILDRNAQSGREHAELIIQSMFANAHIYNAWLAYEPDAFDGRDSEFKYDYPGSPSGRFIRSYIMDGEDIITAPDMDEDTLDDPVISPWYTVPRDTGKLYIDVNNENPNLYDYGVGGDPVYTLSVVAPIYRDDRVIGCVGADVIFLDMTFGIDNGSQAAVAVFYPDGRIFFSKDLTYAEESVDTLGFTMVREIREAIVEGRSLFLPDEYSIFLGTSAFTYFQPVNSGNSEGDNLYLYVATPRVAAFNALKPLVMLMTAIFTVIFLVILVMILYVKSAVTKPIQNLTLAADAISQGNLETEITSFSNEKSEIGAMTRSLHRMVNQFRIYIARMEQAQEEMTVHAQIWDFIKESGSVTQVFNRLSEMLCRHLDLSNVTAVCMDGSSAVIRGFFSIDDARADENIRAPHDFIYHSQVESLIAGKNLLFLNSFAISEQDLQFVAAETVAVCIVPMRVGSKLYGYLIFEHKDKKKTLAEGGESLLTYIARIMADWLSRLEDHADESVVQRLDILGMEPGQAEAEPGQADDVISLLRGVNGLDVDAAISGAGGMADMYERAVVIFSRTIPEITENLNRYVNDKNFEAFTVEIHSLADSLKSIGASAQAKFAEGLENASSSGDAVFCERNYPIFRVGVTNLQNNIEAALQSRIRTEETPGR